MKKNKKDNERIFECVYAGPPIENEISVLYGAPFTDDESDYPFTFEQKKVFCKECGYKLEPIFNYCPICGCKIEDKLISKNQEDQIL